MAAHVRKGQHQSASQLGATCGTIFTQPLTQRSCACAAGGGLEGKVRDHGTYYGVDVDNSLCAVDQSVYATFANCTTS